MTKILDSDRAIAEPNSDEFGFAGIARSLAPRIVEASQGDGLVIGLEGSWGSGKSSLMNLIRQEIDDCDNEKVHTIIAAPWLEGDDSSLVFSVLAPITEIIKLESEASGSDRFKEQAKKLGQLAADYGKRTARWISPIAKLAGHVVSGAELTGKMLDSAENVLETFSGGKLTANELKREVLTQLSDIDHSFIVFLDDLDRLEPAQAVEVVRLVRSVADFPKIVYLMCYDREVLANGLKTGLNVEDGDLFLQKIVQLTFQIPLLEPFDLRQQFLESAKQLYENVTGDALSVDALSDLAQAVSSAGGNLSTPREVKLALNAIRFTYPAIVSDVYFPDLCWLQLLKITRRDFYRWLEEYLSVRSVLVTGEGRLGEGEKTKFGERLAKLLPSEDYTSADSIFGAQVYIPGLSASEKPEERVFGVCYRQDEEKAVIRRRVGSPVHYRYYFALTGPKAIMSDTELAENLILAKTDPHAFRVRLQQYAEELGSPKVSQFLFRLDKEVLATGDVETLNGLVNGFADVMDVVLENQKEAGIFMISLDAQIGFFIRSCLKRIGELDNERKIEAASRIVEEGRAVNWIVSGFIRDQLYRHGRVGDRAKSPDELIFTENELDRLIDAIKLRMREEENIKKIGEMPKLGRYLYSWREIAGDDKEVIAWVEDFCKSDTGFIKLMNSLRHQVTSDHVYCPLSEESVSTFLDFENAKLRLQSMKEGEMAEEAIDLLNAIDLNRD